MNAPKLIITPRRSALLAGHDNELDLLVRIQAPAAPADQPQRRPLNLALVMDRSGSMMGPPLAEAKRCAELIVDSLDAGDSVSLVTYDNRVNVVVPFRQVGDRAGLRRAIRAILPGGTTALYDGWHAGAGQAAKGTERAGVSRVLLLSDGQANRGLTDPAQIAARCAEMAEDGVTTSTYGLGRHFNEELMVAMAEAGGGNSYYGRTAEDLMDPFREEFELLQALCARRLRLALRAPEGISVTVRNRYERDAEGRWRLPDLAYGGEAWAAVRLRVPATLAEQARGESLVLEAAVTFEDLQGRSHRVPDAALRLPWLPAGDYAAVAENPLVAERHGELDAADRQEEARQASLRGDWDRVDELLAQARREAENNPWLLEALNALQRYASRRETGSFAKETTYASRRLRTRLADAAAEIGRYVREEESAKAAFLRRKLEQGRRFEGDEDPRAREGK